MQKPDIKTQINLPFFFIIGRPRSGTTLLRTLFDAHPHVCIPLEAPIIKHLSDKYGTKTNWTKEQLKEFYMDVINIWKFSTWTIDHDKLLFDIQSCEGEFTFRELISIVYLNYISFFDKEDIQLIGDKNPSYSTCTRKIFNLYPEAKYVHLTRDHRDNILSILKVDFEAPHIPLIAYRWRYSAKKIEALKKEFPKQFHTLQYEELVKNPVQKLTEICDFLNIPYHSEMLDFYKKKDEIMQRIPEDKFNKYHSSLLQPIHPEKVFGWKKKMKEKDIKIADLVVGKYAELQGYSREYKLFNPLLYLFILPGIIYGRLSYFITIFIDLLPFNVRMKVRNKGSLLALSYWFFKNLFNRK